MKQIIVFVFFSMYCVIIFSCNNSTQKKFEFYYYPSRNVYYDVADKVYLYSLNGGKSWDSLQTQSNGDPSTLGTKRIVYSSTPDIWKDNAAHIQQYNGQVINITGNDSDFNQAGSIADRKLKKVVKAPVLNTPKKEKRPGFFKRLFGGKRNNN